jgi:hypothetical protein
MDNFSKFLGVNSSQGLPAENADKISNVSSASKVRKSLIRSECRRRAEVLMVTSDGTDDYGMTLWLILLWWLALHAACDI